MNHVLNCVVLAAVVAIATDVYADEPAVKTPYPVIYLADNIDEKDNLGWCIDTLGRGFAERLQAHSCKPQGGDVQFSFDSNTGQIMSVEFSDYCMANRPTSESIFGLETCDTDAAEQRFAYDATRRELSPNDSPDKCVVVGSESRSAGPFMSRTLLLADCTTTDALFKEWIIKE